METSIAYISASTNRQTQAADISSTSLVSFGSANLIGLWNVADDSDHGVSETLPGHEGLVTCVRFISNDLFVSGDDKGALRCWRNVRSQWTSTGTVQAHTKAISALGVHDECFVSGSSDASIKIWEIVARGQIDELKELQTLSLQGKYPLAVTLARLPQSKAIILAVASTESNVQIWTRSEGIFVQSAILAGHNDWVRSLAFCFPSLENGSLILASGSQDATIRLWNIEVYAENMNPQSQPGERLDDVLLNAASLGSLASAKEGGKQLSLKRHIFTAESCHGSAQRFSITFDALLLGHEAGITSLSWQPIALPTTAPAPNPMLLSTSTDSSVILWSPSNLAPGRDGSGSIWINQQRFGDIGGPSLGGFVGGLWALGGNEALAWDWSGSWRRWRRMLQNSEDSDETWAELGAIGGHRGPVKGLDWSPTGQFLISVGLDQKTRIHGAVPNAIGTSSSWHELSRPQVHGYDLLDVKFLDALKFISIADEKVARVFEAPQSFVDLVENLGVASFAEDKYDRPVRASVSPLSLSNKAVTERQPTTEPVRPSHSAIPHPIGASGASRGSFGRPLEGELASVTLWPEIEKVFGHGYESTSLAVSNSRMFIATACKATTPEHAVIRVYETKKWQLVGQPLEGHSLTVTRITFSPDDRFILSVSRDRSWRLFEARENVGFIPIAADKSHGRIIWDCAWAREGDVFATASRDKTVKVWYRGDANKWTTVSTIKTREAATAVDFAGVDLHGWRRLAIGLETGAILIYSSTLVAAQEWRLHLTLDSRMAHASHIHRLAWRGHGQGHDMELASCSEDGTLKILIVQVTVD